MTELPNVPWPGWQAVRIIGQGSFGTVYEIQRKLADGDIEADAMKVISIPQNLSEVVEMYSEGYDDESITATLFQDHLQSIVAEYSLMRKMNGSANIVNCKDICYIQHDDGIGWDIFIRMELLSPMTKTVPINTPEKTVIQVAKDICAALVLCKKHNIVHRDIKPQNIFVSPNGDYKLGDFGIAKTVEKTMGGTKIGTYKFMAPEVYNNQPYGSGADIYSLGLVLYWLLNERRMPFLPLPPAKPKAGQEEAARQRRFSGEPLPPPAHGSKKLQRIVMKACAYHPSGRFSSAEEMLKELNRPNPKPKPKPDPKPNLKPFLAIGIAALLAIVLLSASLLLGWGQRKDPNPVMQSEGSASSPFQETLPGQNTGPMVPVFHFETLTSEDPSYQALRKDGYVCIGFYDVTAETQQPEMEIPFSVGTLYDGCEVVVSHKTADGMEEMVKTVENGRVTVTVNSLSPFMLQVKQNSAKANWSEWSAGLPEDVTQEDYYIEMAPIYRSRQKEETVSENSSLDGWIKCGEGTGDQAYGAWSEWSASEASQSSTRQVETKDQYRYRDRETTTSSSSSLSGWSQYDSSWTWGDYGAWSNWSSDPATDSESRRVESKTQYRSRTITYVSGYTNWSDWGNWQFAYIGEDDLTDVETRTVWGYYYFQCPYCGAHQHGYGTCWTWDGGCGRPTNAETGAWHEIWSPISWSNAGLRDWYGTGHYYTYINGELVFQWLDNGGPTTQYRCRTRSTTSTPTYSSWTDWSDTPKTASSTLEVETQKVYHYQDRSKIWTYYFERWGNWSDWSDSAVSETSTRQVQKQKLYHYRDLMDTTVYYFYRWGNWSGWSTNTVTGNDDMEVETAMGYRYVRRE